jgi:cation transport ATPase
MLKREEYEKLKKKVIFAGLAGIPFLFIMLWHISAPALGLKGLMDILGEIQIKSLNFQVHLLHLLEFFLATPVLFISGKQFFVSAYQALKAKSANMDTLVVLGTFTAWAYSTLITFAPQLFSGLEEKEVFFEASVFIIFFILLGRLLEAKAKSQANEAINKLLELQAKELM